MLLLKHRVMKLIGYQKAVLIFRTIYNYNGLYCGFYANTNESTLSNWQTALGANYDDDSLRDDPEFISSSDLHIEYTSPCFGAGVSISGISTDIDDNSQNATNPNIGADEFTGFNIASGVTVTIGWNLEFLMKSMSLVEEH